MGCPSSLLGSTPLALLTLPPPAARALALAAGNVSSSAAAAITLPRAARRRGRHRAATALAAAACSLARCNALPALTLAPPAARALGLIVAIAAAHPRACMLLLRTQRRVAGCWPAAPKAAAAASAGAAAATTAPAMARLLCQLLLGVRLAVRLLTIWPARPRPRHAPLLAATPAAATARAASAPLDAVCARVAVACPAARSRDACARQ